MIHIQGYIPVKRYAVSLYTYQFCVPGELAHNIKRGPVSCITSEGALRGVMRQAGVQFAHFAKVTDLETKVCYLLNNIRL